MTKFILPLLLILCVPLMADEKKDKESFVKMNALAQKRDIPAQFYLGFMYDNGLGVMKDVKEAVKWYRKAAEQGQANAQNNLGCMYGFGDGVLQDYVTSYAWVNIAGANGYDIKEFKSVLLEKKMTPEQIAEGQKLSKEMVKKNPKLLKD